MYEFFSSSSIPLPSCGSSRSEITNIPSSPKTNGLYDEELLRAIRLDASVLAKAPDIFKSDYHFMIQVARENFYGLEYASDELKANQLFILHATQVKLMSFTYASEELKDNPDFVLKVIRLGASAFMEASKRLRRDRMFVRKAMEIDVNVLNYASDSLKNDPSLQLMTYVLSSQFDPETCVCTRDKEFMKEVVQIQPELVKYASQDLQKDRKTLKYLISHQSRVFSHCPFTNDLDFIIEALQENDQVFEFVTDNLKYGHEIILKLMERKLWEKCKHHFISKLYQNMTPITMDRILTHFSSNYIGDDEEKEIILSLYVTNWKAKPSMAFFKKYPKEKVVGFVLLTLFSDFRINSIEHFIGKQPSVQKSQGYYVFNDSIQNLMERLLQETTDVYYTDLQKEVNRLVDNLKFNDLPSSIVKQIGLFMDDWVGMPNFPSLSSLNALIQKNGIVFGKERRNLHLIRQQEQFKDLFFFSMLGSGGFGCVFSAYHSEYGNVAFKINLNPILETDKFIERFQTLKNLDLKGVVKYFDCGFYQNLENYSYFIMELGTRSIYEELELLFPTRDNPLCEKETILALDLVMEILDAVNTLHTDSNITHRDLDPSNIIVVMERNEKGLLKRRVKLIDLDSSRVVKVNQTITMNIGKQSFMAPEMRTEGCSEKQNTDIFKSCDVFSLGCIFLKVLTGCSLILENNYLNSKDPLSYSGKSCFSKESYSGQYFYAVLSSSYGEEKLHRAIYSELGRTLNIPDDLRELIARCLITMIQIDPFKRGECGVYTDIFKKIKQCLNNRETTVTFTEDESYLKDRVDKFLRYEEFNSHTLIDNLSKQVAQVNEENTQLKQQLDKYRKLLQLHNIPFE